MPHRSTPHRRQPNAAPRHPNRISEERDGPFGGVLRLQRMIGNQATRQLLEARDDASPAPPDPRSPTVVPPRAAASSGTVAPVQRCGGEVHAGCSCADGSSAKDEDAGDPQIQRASEVSTVGAERGVGERPLS